MIFNSKFRLKQVKYKICYKIDNLKASVIFFLFLCFERNIIHVRNCWPSNFLFSRSLFFFIFLVEMCRFSHNAAQIVTMINDEVQKECMSAVQECFV